MTRPQYLVWSADVRGKMNQANFITSLGGVVFICVTMNVVAQDTRDTDNSCSFAADGNVYNIKLTRGTVNPDTCTMTDQVMSIQKKNDDKLNEVVYDVLQLQSTVLRLSELSVNLSREVMRMEEQLRTTQEALRLHQTAAEDCPPFYDVKSDEFGSCYLFVTRDLTWYDAEAFCMSTGGHLIALESQSELDFIVDYICNSTDLRGSHIWTGGNDIGHENQWVWAGLNVEFNFTRWLVYPHPTDGDLQMPDNYRDLEHCMHLFHPHDYHWNDAYCKTLYNSICEFKVL